MRASVADSTSAHYAVGWRAWTSFATIVGQSPFPSLTNSVVLFEGFALPLAIAFVTGFCAYGRETLHLSPSTICGYLSGVAFNLKMANCDASFLSSPPVQMARAGLRRLAAKDNTPSKSRLPFTLDLILSYGVFANSSSASLNHLGLFVAMMLAFSCLLRRSEYIPTTGTQHHLKARDIVFTLNDDTKLGSHEILLQHATQVKEVHIRIPSSKCDQEGLGFTYVFSASAVSTKNLCLLLFRWSVFTRKPADAPFFSAFNAQGGKIWCIDATTLTDTMRSIASKAGFSSAQVACFSTHSLRFGGASTLLAAGVDRYQIQLAGRWKSDAFMVYLLAAHSLFERTQSALSDAAILSFQSVRSVSTV